MLSVVCNQVKPCIVLTSVLFW